MAGKVGCCCVLDKPGQFSGAVGRSNGYYVFENKGLLTIRIQKNLKRFVCTQVCPKNVMIVKFDIHFSYLYNIFTLFMNFVCYAFKEFY